MPRPLDHNDVVGLVHPYLDAHTLGISSVSQLLVEAGFRVAVAGESACIAAQNPRSENLFQPLVDWIRRERVTALGFSDRLDPDQAVDLFGRLVWRLGESKVLSERGGPVHSLYFAGLPLAADRIRRMFGDWVSVFMGDETPVETLRAFGVPDSMISREIREDAAYDTARMDLARDVVSRDLAQAEVPFGRLAYPEFGTRDDSLLHRLGMVSQRGGLPLMRAHVGPYGSDRKEAVAQFLDWCHHLGRTGYLDVLSIGTSQLSQSRFGEDWNGFQDGGGVPINSKEEFRQVYEASQPMLVRTYAGTRNVAAMARLYDETLNTAWHALSLWWFCRTDGRGPLSVRENLAEHIETLRYIATVGKPFEPNIPHHFSFRGGDDVTYVVSAVLAARVAKKIGVPVLILQNMLNTPRSTWGVQDVAKARVLLRQVRALEDATFRVVYQPRAGLDYFSHDLEKAKLQLVSASFLMDDVEPQNNQSPDIVHVVSYSEGAFLATPPVIDESIRLTRAAFRAYRRIRQRTGTPLPETEVNDRATVLAHEVNHVLSSLERSIPDLYSAQGLYEAFRAGFLVAPYLWECRDEFHEAVRWQTRTFRGSVVTVDGRGDPQPVSYRLKAAEQSAMSRTVEVSASCVRS